MDSSFNGRMISLTRNIPNPHRYILMLQKDFSDWAYDEERAVLFKGKWRHEVFKVREESPIDLEIGVGNGFFFSHQAKAFPERNLIGIEIKYKPLIQTVRRARANGATNIRVLRFHARFVSQLFEKSELNNVYVYFPDPWVKLKSHKHRLIQPEFLRELYDLQRPGSFLEFKTDNLDYFEWTLKHLEESPYRIVRKSYDLHSSEWAQENFQTHFEKLWTSKGLKTHLVRAERI